MGSLAAPMAAQAELSSSATVASMYLWRGQDISDSRPAVSADITYNHASGAYASFWMSSEGSFDNSDETDWTAGYSGDVGGLGYDVGYYKFFYPQNGGSFGAANAETYLGLTYKDAGFKAYFDAKGPNDYTYYTFSYGMGPFSALVGYNKAKDTTLEYKHIDLSYAATDRLSFTYSKVFAPGVAFSPANPLTGDKESPIFMVSYSLPVDLK
jgi:uncharacterized protein (TIGR02001 family)